MFNKQELKKYVLFNLLFSNFFSMKELV